MATAAVSISQQARLSYIALSTIRRNFTTVPKKSSPSTSSHHPSDFSGGSFTSSYEPGQPTHGPLGETSAFGAPRLTPKALKHHLDQFVVGQERAKKVLSVAVYNHYQRIQELQRQDEEMDAMVQRRVRREMIERQAQQHKANAHGVGSQSSIYEPNDSHSAFSAKPASDPTQSLFADYTSLTLEKSNILLLGPSGVGKTLMAKTLARVLEVPFSMSDCTAFTQAGYIGEDADVCVQRLLAAANYDVVRAERGIICLDEVDKIATAKVSHGKDVSGEGVQQALLKIIEGTTLQINAKPERGAPAKSSSNPNHPMNNTGSPSSSGAGGPPGSGGGGGSSKGEVYNVRTDNILFIFTGAFIGLQKIIMDRVSRGSIGFGQPIRASGSAESATTLSDAEALFKKFLPFFTSTDPNNSPTNRNPLDLLEPGDLQKFGLIPELVGRVPVATALAALDEEALVRVLTEPRNCLLRQYEQLFQLSGVELRFTSGALREIAKAALGMQTGARGLRTVLERLLGDAMFDSPGSSIRHILINQAVARKEQAPLYFARGQRPKFHATIAAEEEEWERSNRQKADEKDGPPGPSSSPPSSSSSGSPTSPTEQQSFQEYREKAKMTGAR